MEDIRFTLQNAANCFGFATSVENVIGTGTVDV